MSGPHACFGQVLFAFLLWCEATLATLVVVSNWELASSAEPVKLLV